MQLMSPVWEKSELVLGLKDRWCFRRRRFVVPGFRPRCHRPPGGVGAHGAGASECYGCVQECVSSAADPQSPPSAHHLPARWLPPNPHRRPISFPPNQRPPLLRLLLLHPRPLWTSLKTFPYSGLFEAASSNKRRAHKTRR